MKQSPKISIITPSYNQAQFLERTIVSVLGQNYPNLEFIIMDGGSTDGSVDIIKKYEDQLTYWVSEKDSGQSNAINKGFQMATGDWVAWQNSDDTFLPDAFKSLVAASKGSPQADLIIGNMLMIDANDSTIRDMKFVKPSYGALLAEGMILTNQAAFWKRSLHEKLGFLNEDLHYAFDYDWFLRVTKNKIKSIHVNKFWGCLRFHEDTKTSTIQDVAIKEYAYLKRDYRSTFLKTIYYRLRRLGLTILNGNIWYVIRGFTRRLTGST